MNTIFIIAASIALISSLMSITNRNAIHALLYLILSLLSISIIFYISGAPFIAALEVIVYAGAIMVLFIFVVMILNIGLEEEIENKWLKPRMWILPVILACALLAILVYAMRAIAFGGYNSCYNHTQTSRCFPLHNLSYCCGNCGSASDGRYNRSLPSW